MTFGRQMQDDMPMTTHGSILKPEVEFQNGGRPFPKPEVIISMPWIEIFYRNLVRK